MITDRAEKAGSMNNSIFSGSLLQQSVRLLLQMRILHMLMLQCEDLMVSMTFCLSFSPYSRGTLSSTTDSVLTQSSPAEHNCYSGGGGGHWDPGETRQECKLYQKICKPFWSCLKQSYLALMEN